MRYTLAAAVIGTISLLSQNAYAASEEECAIWICAPGGFAPSECSPPHRAMLDRVKDGKSPLPPLSDCMLEGRGTPSNVKGASGVAAYIPRAYQCASYVDVYNEPTCARYDTLPARHVRGQPCIHHSDERGAEPWGCTRTDYYVSILVDGEPMGPIYYFSRSGEAL